MNKERARYVKMSATSKTRYSVTNPSVLLHQALSRASPARRRLAEPSPSRRIARRSNNQPSIAKAHRARIISSYYPCPSSLPSSPPVVPRAFASSVSLASRYPVPRLSPAPSRVSRLDSRPRPRASPPAPPPRAFRSARGRLARPRTSSAAIFSSRARRHRPSALSASAPERAATTAPPTNVALATANAAFSVQNGIVASRRPRARVRRRRSTD